MQGNLASQDFWVEAVCLIALLAILVRYLYQEQLKATAIKLWNSHTDLTVDDTNHVVKNIDFKAFAVKNTAIVVEILTPASIIFTVSKTNVSRWDITKFTKLKQIAAVPEKYTVYTEDSTHIDQLILQSDLLNLLSLDIIESIYLSNIKIDFLNPDTIPDTFIESDYAVLRIKINMHHTSFKKETLLDVNEYIFNIGKYLHSGKISRSGPCFSKYKKISDGIHSSIKSKLNAVEQQVSLYFMIESLGKVTQGKE
jgi:hypothetical protein